MAPMFGVGFFEMLLLFLMVGGGGVPISVPPAPEDPWFAQIAPAQPLYYSAWSGSMAADPNSDNLTERMIAEPEMQEFLREFNALLDRSEPQLLAQAGDEQKSLAEFLVLLTRTVLTHPTCLYLSSFEQAGNGFDGEAALVVNVGELKPRFAELFDRVNAELFVEGMELEPELVELEGDSYHKVILDPAVPALWFGFRGDYLVIALGSDALEKLLDRTGNDTPPWLVDLRERLPIDRVATISYVDLVSIRELAEGLGALPPDLMFMIDQMGLDQLTSYRCVTGLDAEGFVIKNHLGLDGEVPFLNVLSPSPILPEELASIPADAPAVLATKLDVLGLLTVAAPILGAGNPEGDLKEFSNELDQISGFTAEELFSEVLSDTVSIYASPSDGGLMTGWVAVVPVQDPKSATRAFERMTEFFTNQMNVGDQPFARADEIDGHPMWVIDSAMDTPFSFAFILTDKELVVSPFAKAAIGHVRRAPDHPSLSDNPWVAEKYSVDDMEGSGLRMVARLDHTEIIQVLHPYLMMGMREVARAGNANGFDFDPAMVPSVGALTRHALPVTGTLVKEKDGYYWEAHQTIPVGEPATLAPLLGIAGVPAVMVTRTSTYRQQSTNNLRQIGLAMHNFHDTYNRFPARYSQDAKGKALLSWRVHILPFIDQVELYNEFHLDEPWDSEHNRALVARMPIIYAQPGTDSTTGMTGYLGNSTENGVILNDQMAQPERPDGGMRMASIVDGTSNTLMVVEANEANRVIWTRPDDFESVEMEPLQMLLGNWKEGFLAAFCDGSVQVIPATIGERDLQRLFDRQDGEVIEWNR